MLWNPLNNYTYTIQREPLPSFGYDGLLLADNYVGERKVNRKVKTKSRKANKAARKARRKNG